MQRWDAIIVGAGPAGCAAAWDLASAGYTALLLDRADFPRPKACAGGLTRKSLRALRYSVAPVVRETVSRLVVESRSGETATLASRTAVCAMTVRQELDAFCLRQTRAAGAEFQRIGPILTIEENDREVMLRTAERSFCGRFLIGADGVHSRVRQFVRGEAVPWFRRGFALEAQVYPAVGNDSDLVFDLAPVQHGYGWIFPKGDHLNVGLYIDSEGEKLDRSRLSRYIGERFSGARAGAVTGQFLGFGAGNAPTIRTRIFLVGDAGGFADPLTGEGIHGAIASGQAAAAAIQADLKGRQPAWRSFAALTDPLRRDLRLSDSGARWFYGNPDPGFRALTSPLFRGAVINAYANGTKIAALANAIRRFARAFTSASTVSR